jgi:hypothetical protein
MLFHPAQGLRIGGHVADNAEQLVLALPSEHRAVHLDVEGRTIFAHTPGAHGG